MTQVFSNNDETVVPELLDLLESALKQADKLELHIVAIHINEAIEALKSQKPCS